MVTTTDNRTYSISWWTAAQPVALMFGMIALMQLRAILKGPPNVSWSAVAVTLPALALASAWAFRRVLRVHVSPDGIRGAASRMMKWSEVTDVEPSNLPRGFTIKSTYAPSISIAESIARSPEFRNHVLGLIPEDHPIALALNSTDGLRSAGRPKAG